MAENSSPEISIFLAVIEMEEADRAAYLDQACRHDPKLRARVEALVAADHKGNSFLDRPAPGLDRTMDVHTQVMEAGLSQAFGAHDAVVLGKVGHSVLRSLGQTIDIPRVMLREAEEEGADPIQRPGSREIPDCEVQSRYRFDGEIARGGMGAILKGRDNDLGRDLAIKVLLDGHKDKPEVIQRFIEEAQIGGQLQHPGIAPIYELGQFADKRPFFSMKLVKGQTLSRLLGDRQDTHEERARFLGIFEQVCQTMAYAHSRGVIHRDLKPANIMVGAFGEVQVMDWGLAKVLSAGGVADEKKAHDQQQGHSIIQTLRSGVGSDAPARFGSVGSETQMGSVMGTPAYMPPEQALGEIDNLDERADVFGLGAILCEILTGKPPYVGEDGTQVFRMASRGNLADCFARLDACGAEAELIALTKGCLELEPKDRLRDAGVLAERVTAYLESVEAKLRQAELARAAEATRVVEQKKRLRVTLALAASVLVIVLGGGAVAWWQKEQANARKLAEERAATELARLEGEQKAERTQRQLEVAQREAADVARLARNGEAVVALLGQAEEALKADDAAKAQVALDAATRRSAEGGAEQDAERLQRLEADLSLLRDLDAVDQFGWTWSENRFPDAAAVATRTREALKRFGADPESVSVDQAATRVSGSAVRDRIVSALDRLLLPVRLVEPHKLSVEQQKFYTPQMLADVAAQLPQTVGVRDLLRRVDADPYRDAVRDAVIAEDRAKFVALAGDKAAETQPPAFAAWLGASKVVSDERRRQLLHQALRQRPEDLGLLMTLGCSYMGGNKEWADERLRWFQAAIASAPANYAAHVNLGGALQDKGQLDEASACFRKAIALDPQPAQARIGLGNSLSDKGQLDEAIASFHEALALDPKNALAHYNLGITLREKGDVDGAIDCHRKAIELDPKCASAWGAVGAILCDIKGDFDGAIVYLRRSRELDSTTFNAHYNLGTALSRKGQVDEAVGCFRKAIEINPKSAQAYNSLGAALIQQGLKNEAVASFRKATEFEPTSARNHGNLGTALLASGLSDEAIASYRKAIELEPSSAENHARLGSARMTQGDLDGALASFRKAIELDPRHASARERLARAERLEAAQEQLPALLKGDFRPTNNSERLVLADLCQFKKLYRAAAGLHADALAADPKLADDLQAAYRYKATCSAALAAAGQGEDATQLDEPTKAKLRGQALDWLTADLTALRMLLDSGPAPARPFIAKTLIQWQGSPALSSIRDKEALAKLTEDEQKSFTQLWADVQTLLRSAEEKSK